MQAPKLKYAVRLYYPNTESAGYLVRGAHSGNYATKKAALKLANEFNAKQDEMVAIVESGYFG